jgi:hypothetical protein
MTQNEALRLALEALEKLFGIPDKWTGEGGGDVAVWRLGGSYRAQQAITAIKAALEAKDEPVAWMYDWTTSEGEFIQNWTTSEAETLRDTEPTIITNVRPLYTTPPQRKPLTVEEIAKLDCYDHLKFARAIEAAHGIKGEA